MKHSAVKWFFVLLVMTDFVFLKWDIYSLFLRWLVVSVFRSFLYKAP